MEKSFPRLEQCPLFSGINPQNLPALLRCLDARVSQYNRGESVLSEGDPARYLGIVLAGNVQVVQTDYFGNKSILGELGPGELLGESFACAGVAAIPVNAVATTCAQVMLIPCGKITSPCGSACEFHRQIIYNLLKIVAGKNLAFQQKIEVMSKRSTREKLAAYLTLQAKKNNQTCFTIPYSRQELADYLGVERSGLSVELGKLVRQGFLETERKRFKLLKPFEP